VRVPAAVGLACLALAGCGEKEEPSVGAPADVPEWERVPTGLGEIPVAEFNAYAAQVDERWERSPVLLAAEFARVDASEARSTSVVSRLPPEGGDTARLAVTLDGLLDDSIRSTRLVLDAERSAGAAWRMRSARREQRCHRGRGHAEFEARPCS
jgi:hypothetical protein